MPEARKPTYFATAADFRRWLASNHDKAAELWVGFWKKDSGKAGMSYDEAVDEALCYGWIDGLVNRHDERSYKQRFTPRKPTSVWSAVNVARIERLKAAGRMARPGLAAFGKRDPGRTGTYSFENRDVAFSPALERRFRGKAKAWSFFAKQPPGYRRLMAFWVMSAKREETRTRRLAKLIERSAAGERIQ
jgi:uncharacterized protein YdeI (YjbR/CyaY-like superfamily)